MLAKLYVKNLVRMEALKYVKFGI